MNQKKIGDKLYVFSETPYVITEDTDADVIIIQLECVDGFAELNSDLADKMVPYNYHMFTVKPLEWSDYYNDYTITVASVTGGTLSASPLSADPGEEVTLTNTPSTGYEFVSYNVTSGGEPVTVTDNKFTMPEGNVTVSGTFDKLVFDITIDPSITNGTITTNVNEASLGDTITITATPELCYALDTLTVMNGDLPVTVTNNQFTMPLGDVTISAIFTQIVEYLTFESLEDDNVIGFNSKNIDKTIEVSTDKTNWTEKTSSTEGTELATLNTGDKLYIRGNNTTYSMSNTMYTYFTSSGTFNASGNILSILSPSSYTSYDENVTGVFRYLFKSSKVVDISELEFPDFVANTCYRSMFTGCTLLTTGPVLPATTLIDNCYSNMFDHCTSLASITCLATSIDTNTTTNWLSSVASEGTFTKAASMSDWTTGVSGIPTGWTVVDYVEPNS